MFPNDTSILIVDDMMTMRKLVKKALTTLGYSRIADAENGEVAFKKLQASISSGTPFQLVISDWNMPVMTGIELLRAVRALPQGKALPFILLTAESEKSQVIEALQAKVSGYVIKPFTAESLAEKMAAVHATTQAKTAAA